MSQNLPLGSCFRCIFCFSVLKASVDLPRLLWIYVLLLHTPFVFPYRSKRLPLDILIFLVTTLINKYNKVSFIKIDEYGALERSSEFMKTCHNTNIIVQSPGEDASYLIGKNKIPNKTLDNIKRALLLNSIHKKEPW